MRSRGWESGTVTLERGNSPHFEPVPDSFRNVIFDISPGDEAGKFEVNAKFLGVDMERFQLHYQVRGHSHEPQATCQALGASRMTWADPR